MSATMPIKWTPSRYGGSHTVVGGIDVRTRWESGTRGAGYVGLCEAFGIVLTAVIAEVRKRLVEALNG